MQDRNTHSSTLQSHSWLNNLNVFCILWLLMFVLYYPAAKAGFVTDFTGWLDQIQNHSFGEYINRSNFNVHSLYQVTQFNTWIFYKLLGINHWLWHLLFITLHVINSTLLFVLCYRLLDDMGVRGGRGISFTGVLLFCVSPYISEVVAWMPAFHFLQGLLFILLILCWLQKFMQSGDKKYALWAALIYLFSTHTLEVFYITPWLVLVLALFYNARQHGKKLFTETLLLFFLPELMMFCLRLVEFRVVYGSWVSRIGTDAVTSAPFIGLGKPAKYLFHLLFLGRFFQLDTCRSVYTFCDSAKGIISFYVVMVIIWVYLILRFRNMAGKGRVVCLLFTWILVTFVLLLPLPFVDILLVLCDRYTYFTGAFFYMLLSVLAAFITIQYVRLGIISIYALANLRYAIQVSRYWGKAANVDNALLYNLPDAGSKIIVLLNIPESMHGIPMIGAETESEYKLSHNLLVPGKKIENRVYDALSYNMITPGDGAHVTVLNDSMVRVTLNQWGTWWWYNGLGGHSYENPDYKLNMIDGGHFYELTIKKPATQYLLLYQVGDKWKTVDMNKKPADLY